MSFEILSNNVVILTNNVVILSNNVVILSNNDVILTLPRSFCPERTAQTHVFPVSLSDNRYSFAVFAFSLRFCLHISETITNFAAYFMNFAFSE